jgi:peptidylprolyl isomerase
MNTTTTGIAVALAIIVALGFLFFGFGIFSPFTSAAPPADTMTLPGTGEATTSNQNDMQAIDPNNLPTQLTGKDEVVGTGATAEAGDQVTVNYVGALPDGTVFDASQNHGQPFTFTLGAGQVIKGWDAGVAGMKEGGKRMLVIPPDMAYGSQAVGSIPPNSTLVFEVELLKVEKPQ